MKHLLFITLALLPSLSYRCCAQASDTAKIFADALGIKEPAGIFYEVEGYDVAVENIDHAYSEKEISKIKKGYDISTAAEMQDSTMQVYVKESVAAGGVKQLNIYYIAQNKTKHISAIAFTVYNERDTLVEHVLVNAICNNTVPPQVYTPLKIGAIKFAGRPIAMNADDDKWMKPHSVDREREGMIKWAEFRSMEKAKEWLDTQYKLNTDRNKVTVVKEEDVDVAFEGVDTKAHKLLYNLKTGLLPGGNTMIKSFYMVQEVRGRIVACELRCYTDDEKSHRISPILMKVMRVK